jgi:hypothetical protein
MLKRRFGALAIAGACLLVAGCSHENPLKAKSDDLMASAGIRHDGDSDRPFVKIALAQNNDGRLVCFALKNDYFCYLKDQSVKGSNSSTWPTGWTGLGAPDNAPLATIAAGKNYDGAIYVFGVKISNGSFWYRKQNPVGNTKSFNAWTNVYNSGIYSNLVVSNYSDGTIVVFGKRLDNYLYAMRRDKSGAWQSAVKLGKMTIDQKFNVLKNSSGQLMVFMSKGGYLYSIQQTGATAWESDYKQMSYFDIDPDADIAVTLNANNYPQVFVSAKDNDVLTLTQTSSGGWTPLWLIDNQFIQNVGMSGAYKRMVVGKSGITKSLFLVFCRPNTTNDKWHEIGFISQAPGGSWTQTRRFGTTYSFILNEYINANNLDCSYYSDGKMAFFNSMNYSDLTTAIPYDDIMVHTVCENSSQPSGWTYWYGLGDKLADY